LEGKVGAAIVPIYSALPSSSHLSLAALWGWFVPQSHKKRGKYLSLVSPGQYAGLRATDPRPVEPVSKAN